jgi:propanol-preferring alcohol dehydrogenase
MVLHAPSTPLRLEERPLPRPGPGEVLLRVHACGVCRTDLHIVDGELAEPALPLVPGHEIVGVVVERGAAVTRFAPGDRVGVPWLGATCGVCPYCARQHENLCDRPSFTGYTRDGGYAEHAVADARYCFPLPAALDDMHVAPLLCAGLIGYRALKMAGDARRLGIYGFGAAAHLIAQVAVWQGREVHAFTRPGDTEGQDFARSLGCRWAGDSTAAAPAALDAAMIFAPVGALVPLALQATRKGGTVVCAGIHMSDIPAFPYRLLWGERAVRSVANLTRADGDEFLALAARIPLRTHVEVFDLARANEAIDAVRHGRVHGAAVLDCRLR